jgi:hypothetical protein
MPKKLPAVVVPTIGSLAPLDKLFLLNPNHALFLTGRTATVPIRTPWLGIILGIVFGVASFGCGLTQREPLLTTLMLLGSVLFALLVGWLYLDTAETHELSKKGKVIEGWIIKADAGWQDSKPRKVFRVPIANEESDQIWVVELQCGFQSPSGKILTRHNTIVRPDLADFVPDEGTPIAVLYLSDHRFQIL